MPSKAVLNWKEEVFMTIEVLFPELCNLYGDQANMAFLRKCVPDAVFHYTHNHETPRFVSEHVDLIYLGAMAESKQELALTRLRPYREMLWQLIEEGLFVLATSNSIELFGQQIRDGERVIPALGYFSFSAKRDMDHRHNSMFLGSFEGMKIVGNKSQYSFSYGQFDDPFIHVTGGCGMNPDAAVEGIRYKNFFATYLLGPFLILNPPFTKYLLNRMGHNGPLAVEDEAMDAYNYRLKALERPGVNFMMGEHG